MRYWLIFLFITLIFSNGNAQQIVREPDSIGYVQQKTTIYFIPGQGADKRLFDSLTIDSRFTKKYIEFTLPEKGTTLKQYAKSISTQIDTSQAYILVGVSLGGMICVELSELLKTDKVIIISSAKNRNELPFRYKFQKAIPIYKLFPSKVLWLGAKFLQPLVEPDRKHNKETFKSMLSAKDPKFIKRTIDMIIRWDRETNSKTITHIHGDNDHTLPITKVKCDYVISNGSHMMTLTRGKEISAILNKELETSISSR